MRTTVFVRASCLMALCASLLLPACGGEKDGKTDFPFVGFRLTNHDVDRKDVTATVDIGGTSYVLMDSPIKVDQFGHATPSGVSKVKAFTLSMKVGNDTSARAWKWEAAGHGGEYIRGVNVTYDQKEGGTYHVKGQIVVYTDLAKPKEFKPVDVEDSF